MLESLTRLLHWQWGARTVRAIVVLATAFSVHACTPSQPVAPPLPVDAVALRTPRDIDGVWLDVQAAKVRDVLTPDFGPLTIAEYKVNASWTWDSLLRHFDAGLSPTLQRYGGLPTRTRHFRIAAWSRDGRAGKPMVALAQIDAPPSTPAPPHRVILVFTPRAD